MLVVILVGVLLVGGMWIWRLQQTPEGAFARPGGIISVAEVTAAFTESGRSLRPVATPSQDGLVAWLGTSSSPVPQIGRGVYAWVWEDVTRARAHERQLSSEVLGQGIDIQSIDNVVVSVPHSQATQIIPALSTLAVPPVS